MAKQRAGNSVQLWSVCGCRARTARMWVLHFPITSQKPTSARFAAKIPATEKRRAGLSNTLHLWLILDECNQDVVGKSFYLEAAILIMV